MRTDVSMVQETEKQASSSILENLLVKQRMNPDDVSTIMMDMIILGVQAVNSFIKNSICK